jgi:uncharacterized protein YigA (DUF484 family)
MTISPQRSNDVPGDEDAVATWLRDNPDFFLRHEELLGLLKLPHTRGTAISLVERQVEVLRDKHLGSEAKLTELVRIARGNEILSARIHKFTRRLMAAPTRRETLIQIETSLREDFDASQLVLLLFAATADTTDARYVRRVSALDANIASFESLLGSGKPRCGQVRDSQREFLFGSDSGEIGSLALVPLGGSTPMGLLVLGSHQRERFHPGMSTEFLALMGELISDALTRD